MNGRTGGTHDCVARPFHASFRGALSMRFAGSACAAAMAAVLGAGMSALAWAADMQPSTSNGTTYVTGGLGTEEQETLKQLEQEGYTLKLVFAERTTGA